MPVIQLLPYIVFESFPECRDEFRHLYSMDESFQMVCENYQQCSDALRYWADSKDENAPELYQEYQTLLTELELEIQQYCSDECREKLRQEKL